MDVIHFKELWRLACKAQEAQINVKTRAQAKKLTSEKLNDHVLNNKIASASPDSADLQAVEEEVVVESDITVAENEDEHSDNSSSNITDEVIEQTEDIDSDSSALAKDLTEMGDSEEWPLPKLSTTDSDKKELLLNKNKTLL